mmetsp:Transcript_4580/g.12508  ORF Transcript_4580/g.12508 Transcript_4580/m.12508 type:complete len:304 (-) Transcript_4580:925-1836(-)
MLSAWFLVSTASRFFLSSPAKRSASATILSTSSLPRVEAPVILMSCFLPEPLSVAVTDRIPLASMSNFTSIWGMPRGAGGMPSRRKVPRDLLSRANSRSPCSTLISTLVWPSAAVENTSDLEVGRVVLRVMSLVATPPRVSRPRDRGVTSSSTMSLTSPDSTPACTAAPRATTSSGFTEAQGSLPHMVRTTLMTEGIRVEPPTRMTSLMSAMVSLASRRAFSTGILARDSRSEHSSSNLTRDSWVSMCLGPSGVAVMKGKLMLVWVRLLSSHLAFSAASVNLCSACLSLRRSMPSFLLNSSAM